jgi:hypothetical protein
MVGVCVLKTFEKHKLCTKILDYIGSGWGQEKRQRFDEDKAFNLIVDFYKGYNKGAVSADEFISFTETFGITEEINKEFVEFSNIKKTARTECVLNRDCYHAAIGG